MIQPEHYRPMLRALHRLIVHARSAAYEHGDSAMAELLDAFELLPEMLADDADRTDEAIELLHSTAESQPECRYIIDEFERADATSPTSATTL